MMTAKRLLLAVVIANWIAAYLLIITLLNSPLIIAPLVPSDLAQSPLYPYYRHIGTMLLLLAGVLLASALAATSVWWRAWRSPSALLSQEADRLSQAPVEKQKRRPSDHVERLVNALNEQEIEELRTLIDVDSVPPMKRKLS
ncbi:MAG: hypothetical protein U0528_16600 [Anaerolineae bacterium]|nr:hypothetical protein [Anaerolineae bacterium]